VPKPPEIFERKLLLFWLKEPFIKQAWTWPCWNCTGSYNFWVSVKKMGEGWTGGASDIVKAKSSGEDPRATGGLVSNLPHSRVNKTKQHYRSPSVFVISIEPGSLRYKHTATHCNTLQHTATHCNTLQQQHTATQCKALQGTATHCNTLQHTATHCNALQHTTTHCNTPQRTATHCNTIQRTGTHCIFTHHPQMKIWLAQTNVALYRCLRNASQYEPWIQNCKK